MAQIKTEHTSTGQSEILSVVNRSSVRYYADFSSGAGTVQLQVKIGGDWLPADTAITSTMSVVEVADAPSSQILEYRWNVSAFTSGTIVTYLA